MRTMAPAYNVRYRKFRGIIVETNREAGIKVSEGDIFELEIALVELLGRVGFGYFRIELSTVRLLLEFKD